MVAKIPKEVEIKKYNVESLSNELALVSICSKIVGLFNERIISQISNFDLLRDFVRPYIYELLDPF